MYFKVFCGLILTVSAWADPSTKAEKPTKDVGGPHIDEVIQHILGKKQDPSIEFIVDSGDGPKSSTIEIYNKQGPKLPASTVAVFKELPGKAPYRIESRRQLQEESTKFYVAQESQDVLNSLKETAVGFGISMIKNTYLPGERVTWQICSKSGEVLKKVTCCPNPVVVENSSGEVMVEVGLLQLHAPTTYVLMFPERKQKIDFVLSAGSKSSKGTVPAGKLDLTTFVPQMASTEAEVGRIELIQDGKSYKIELPYGRGFKKYIDLGNEEIKKLNQMQK